MKTVRQLNDYTCGPVAVYNALVLLGFVPPSILSLQKALGTTKDGTDPDKMSRFLLALNNLSVFDATNLTNPELRLSALPTKREVLLLGYYAGQEGHYTVIDSQMISYNCSSDHDVENLPHSKLKAKHRVSPVWLDSKLQDLGSELYVLSNNLLKETLKE